jgi:TPR repeat protein
MASLLWRGRRHMAGVAAVLVAMITLSGAALAESRVALVIGNGAYATGALANPRNDADGMARTLRGVGFDVIRETNADMQTMRSAFTEFGRRLKRPDSVGVFYYAGHAVQVAGQNYLIPIGADITSEAEIPLQAVNLAEMLGAMKGASARVRIAILDACRNNPFASVSRSPGRGLAQVSAPVGTLIAYATAPGEVAFDGQGGNSPFTAALMRNIPIPGLAVEDVFKRTREDVLEATQNAQTPWEHSSLVGQFIFKPKAVAPEPSGATVDGGQAAPDDRRLAEIAAWERIRTATDPMLFRRHVEAYPGGAYEELAHYKIVQLERRPSGWSWLQTGNPTPGLVRGEGDAIYERALKLEASGDDAALAEAVRLYRLAAESGVVTAMLNLARMLDRGRGGPRNVAEAARWYAAAAEADNPAAQGSLGTMYEYGDGVAANLVDALRLYRLSAERGDAHGMTSLGYLYASGKGVARDPVEARKWYAAAADKGHARAMFNLALLQMKGEGGAADPVVAIGWFNAAVDRGHSGAMRELAYLHDEGRIVARDPGRAAEYFVAALGAMKIEAGKGQAAASVAAAKAMVTRDHWTYATRRATQKRLIAEGRLRGPATGLFDAGTRRALLALADVR